MENGKYCIAIMSIGSGVGQSVVTSCNLSKLPIKTIGLGMNPMAFGAYECDVMDYVPIIYSKDYIPELIDKCYKHKIDLIIPGSDDEALILAEHKSMLEENGFKVLVSDEKLISLIRDKAKMCDELSSISDVFVKNYNFEEIKSLIENNEISFPLIAKPRDGYASKGIEILLEEKDLVRVTNQHIIQELAIPHKGDPFRQAYLQQISKKVNSQLSEISIQIVTNKNGDLMGRMASYNKLNNGVPIEIIPYDNEYIWSEIDKLIPMLKQLGHRGPLNIQGRLTDKGLKLFEMNARFTGITGLRAIMGFNEVECCIKDWLNLSNKNETLKLNYGRFGIRQTTDKIISLNKNKRIKELSLSINKKELKTGKIILVTGASGYLGQTLIKKLLKSKYEVWALSRNKFKIEKLYNHFEGVKCFEYDDIKNGSLSIGLVDTIIHCGFARPHKGNEEITDSLNFTNQLFNLAAIHQIPEIINISSQSVYGTKQAIYWTEKTKVMPETIYAQAKYCTELMAENIKLISKHSNVTSLRLSSLAGGQEGLVPVDIISKFVINVINNETIEVIDGKQKLQRLDIRDAADGIIALLKTNSDEWETVYNLGMEGSYTVLEMADMATKIGKEMLGSNVIVNVKAEKIDLELGMDSNRFYSLTKWKPRYSLKDIVESLFKYYRKER